MKQKLLTFMLSLFVGCFVLAQNRTGINTTTPRKTLEVNGTTKISGNLSIGTINDVTDADTYTFLMQEPSKKIKALDAANATPGNALGYFIRYRVKKVDQDWVQDFDTGINANKFVVYVIASRFTKSNNSDPQIKIVVAKGFAPAMVSAFKAAPTGTSTASETWHLKADYPGIATKNGQKGLWSIKLLVVSKDIIKELPAETFNMSGNSTGTDSSPALN